MGLTAFPNGVSSFGIPQLGSGDDITTGNVFFVDAGSTNSANTTSNGSTPGQPFFSINYAIGRCTANNGDIIYVMPGHTENLTSDITMDVAGVWVRGLGWGSSRPTINLGTTTSAFVMSSSSSRVSNLRFTPGTANVADAIVCQSNDGIVEHCETVVHATNEFTRHIKVDGSPLRVRILNNTINSLAATGSSSGIYLDGCTDAHIIGNLVTGHFGLTAALDNVTGSVEALGSVIMYNIFHNDSSTAADLAVNMDDDATGVLAYNAISGGLALAANYNFGSMRCIENYVTDALDVFALIAPTTTAA